MIHLHRVLSGVTVVRIFEERWGSFARGCFEIEMILLHRVLSWVTVVRVFEERGG